MKITIFEVNKKDHAWFDSLRVDGHVVDVVEESLSMENASKYSDSDLISVFIDSEVTVEVLNQLSNLQLVSTRSTGYDHIDISYCKSKNVVVCNVPSYAEYAVAEYVFALLLSISRKIYNSIERTRVGDFSREGLQGFDLCGKTIGVIGVGAIGKQIIRLAKGFDMNVFGSDVNEDPLFSKELNFQYTSVADVLEKSDIISINIPGAADTENLINKEAFSRMKDNVVIINTARGSVIDTEALVEALSSGQVAAAGLDVLTQELWKQDDIRDVSLNQMLLNMDNVFITPHNAFNSKEAFLRTIDISIKTMKEFLAGNLINSV